MVNHHGTTIWAVFKIFLSLHCTGWFMGIPLLYYHNPQWLWRVGFHPRTNHQPTGFWTLLNCCIYLVNVYKIWKITIFSGKKSQFQWPFSSSLFWQLRTSPKTIASQTAKTIWASVTLQPLAFHFSYSSGSENISGDVQPMKRLSPCLKVLYCGMSMYLTYIIV